MKEPYVEPLRTDGTAVSDSPPISELVSVATLLWFVRQHHQETRTRETFLSKKTLQSVLTERKNVFALR